MSMSRMLMRRWVWIVWSCSTLRACDRNSKILGKNKFATHHVGIDLDETTILDITLKGVLEALGCFQQQIVKNFAAAH